MNKNIYLTAAAVFTVMMSPTAVANTWDLEANVDTCVALACDLIGIGVGDTLPGFLTASDAASGPDSTFGSADVTNYLVSAQGVSVGPDAATITSATLTTDASSELADGNIEFLGTFDAGFPFGLVDVVLVLDVTSSSWTASTDLLGLGTVASGPLTVALEPDGDDVGTLVDNCTETANASQCDSDMDGFGNHCDGDFNNDGFTNFGDLGLFGGLFGTTSDAPLFNAGDFDCSGGVIGFPDLGLFADLFGSSPGR